MKSIKRKGFTLVELLIVIVVIGILAAMMMLSSTEAVSSAKANNIISNLRNLKTATLSWYTDNIDSVTYNASSKKCTIKIGDTTYDSLSNYVLSNKTAITKYLSNESSLTLMAKGDSTHKDGDYTLNDVNYKDWYVSCKVGTDAKVKEKLAARAGSLGLVGFPDKGKLGGEPTQNPYTNAEYVGLLVQKLDD
ncbi:MAG: type II secretion system protein [Synergistaceae bacterium]|nr:type II secretion system protein [Synergistaceae bacterium]